jgi:hypothetical protein
MKTTLEIRIMDQLDTKLESCWKGDYEHYHDLSWSEHIQSLDENITEVNWNATTGITNIIFNTEEALTFFILKWS